MPKNSTNNTRNVVLMLNSIIKKTKKWFIVKRQIKKIKKDLKKPKTFIY
jgi:hypothetical protein